ncbi:helix-turn-helix transcriptional regulator [Embleya sp. NPDC050493]|uniref:helix-turn-helix transcriptional regulator n=1 Tax=Embleya sp. NPDC050493 TaxID=3363989 RepID=UPI0037A65167
MTAAKDRNSVPLAIFVGFTWVMEDDPLATLQSLGFRILRIDSAEHVEDDLRPSVVVAPFVSQRDRARFLETSRRFDESPIVAVVAKATSESARQALSCGACVIFASSAPPDEAAETVRQASIGYARFPVHVTRHMHRKAGVSDAGPVHVTQHEDRIPDFTEEQLEWLRTLEDESLPMKEVAQQFSWSRAEFYRRLHSIFASLGVSTRREAVKRAKELGILC